MRWWLRRREPVLPAYADDGSMIVVGGSRDPARADSEVVRELASAGVDLSRPLLVRHHLVLPDEPAVERARALLADEGYAVTAGADGTAWRARASRTQLLTGLSVAQERSRMAGLAQRLRGDVEGWDACVPPA